MLEAIVGPVDDLVDRERRRRSLGVVAVPRGKRFGHLVQPFVEQLGGPRIERREAADDPAGALRDDELRVRHDEQRRSDYGDAESLEDRWQAHLIP